MKYLIMSIVILILNGCNMLQPTQPTVINNYYTEQTEFFNELNEELGEYMDTEKTNITKVFIKDKNVHTINITDEKYQEEIKTPTSTITIVAYGENITTTITNEQGTKVRVRAIPIGFITGKINEHKEK